MSLRTELPCPHCGAPISMALGDFMPRRYPWIYCGKCSERSQLPFVSRLLAISIMCVFFFVVVAVLKPLGVFDPETLWGVAGKGVVFVLMVLSAMPVTGLLCRLFVRRLIR